MQGGAPECTAVQGPVNSVQSEGMASAADDANGATEARCTTGCTTADALRTTLVEIVHLLDRGKLAAAGVALVGLVCD
jgi:hypothetical protein